MYAYLLVLLLLLLLFIYLFTHCELAKLLKQCAHSTSDDGSMNEIERHATKDRSENTFPLYSVVVASLRPFFFRSVYNILNTTVSCPQSVIGMEEEKINSLNLTAGTFCMVKPFIKVFNSKANGSLFFFGRKKNEPQTPIDHRSTTAQPILSFYGGENGKTAQH